MNDDMIPPLVRLDRRRLLASAMLGVGAAAYPGGTSAAQPGPGNVRETLPPMTAQATEGPYYLPLNLVRADITEGLPGIPVDIRFTVINEAGEPYAGALVDIWHCDAQGTYSGFDQPGGPTAANLTDRTFLRGVQTVGAGGTALFHSIYPGWYPGRTTHIHFKIRQGARTNLTSQFFLPDTLSEFLYSQVPAYRREALRDTLNSNDGIAIEAGDTVEGSVRETKGRYLVSLTVRVDRAATPLPDRHGGPGGPPPGPPPGWAEAGFERRPDGSPQGPAGRLGPPPLRTVLQGEQRTAALLPGALRNNRSMRREGSPFG
ncbi:MAG: intradiol ring-cleavage dioxygenase [Lysobacteraceae bacterium]|nr:MAG: intradiol ring-cleavage dioxygenase [Xanthomonadaceae bacterium]